DSQTREGAGQPSSAEAERRRAAGTSRDPTKPPVMNPEDTVLVDARLKEDDDQPPPPGDLTRLERLVTLIRSRNPYELDRNGELNLPGFAPIALGGLSEQQATQRLSLEPALIQLDVRL